MAVEQRATMLEDKRSKEVYASFERREEGGGGGGGETSL